MTDSDGDERLPGNDTLLLELVAQGLEYRERGEAFDLRELCVAHPHLIEDVAAGLGLADEIPRMREAGVAEDPLFGATLGNGRYRLFSREGAGAMGVVYRAEDQDLDRLVAIKVVRSDAQPSAQSLARFQREGEALAAVRHPAIVAVHDRGETDDGRLYLVMELVDGMPLFEARRRLSVRQIVRLVARVAEGLAAAHAAGVFHRDVKPSNILVRRDGRPVLVDFGIAARSAQATLSRGTAGIGTPSYMAPEQLVAGTQPHATADVYGLTATLYEALTARAPYEGTPSQVLARIPREDPVPAERLRPDLPRDLVAILDQGMHRDPAARYQSATALRDDLHAFLEYEPVTARYLGPLRRAWRRARRSVAARTALVVLALTGAALWGQRTYAQAAEREADHNQTAWRQEWRRVEPLLTLWNPADRRMQDDAARAEARRRLDRAAERCAEPIPTVMVRAAFLFDHGEREAAAEDMARIAAHDGSAIAAAFARAYARATSGGALSLADLPEPSGRDGLFLLAFHEIRDPATRSAGLRRLADQRLADYGPAIELRLVGEIARAAALQRARHPEALDVARVTHRRAERLEERYGHATATTHHLTGGSLLQQGRYAEAVPVLEAGLELAPFSAGLHGNLAIAKRRLADFEAAERHCRRAIELRPHSASAYRTLFDVMLERQWFGGEDGREPAMALLASAPISETERRQRRGIFDLELAFLSLHRGRPDAAAEHARNALEHWRDLAADQVDAFNRTAAAALADGQRPIAAALRALQHEPTSWPRLLRTLALMPDRLEPPAVAALTDTLRALIEHLSPEVELTRIR